MEELVLEKPVQYALFQFNGIVRAHLVTTVAADATPLLDNSMICDH
jgi:hypothetical protein